MGNYNQWALPKQRAAMLMRVGYVVLSRNYHIYMSAPHRYWEFRGFTLFGRPKD
jgi:hypothetical protein